MMPFAETFQILTRTVTGQDADGNDVYGTVEQDTHGALAQAGGVELVQGQATVIDQDSVYLDEGQPVPGPQDQMRVRDVVRDVDGMPAVWRNPFTGWEPGAVVRLVKVTG